MSGFPHERLDVFHISMELTVGVERIAAELPRGHADLKDQVRRAASATTTAITEGAMQRRPKRASPRSLPPDEHPE